MSTAVEKEGSPALKRAAHHLELTPEEEILAITGSKIKLLGRLLKKVAVTSEWHPNLVPTLSWKTGALPGSQVLQVTDIKKYS